MLAEAKLDFRELEGFLDRVARFQKVLLLLLRQLGLCLRRLIGPLLRDGIGDEAHAAPEHEEGNHGQAGHDGEHEHQGGGHHQSPGIGTELVEHGLLRLPFRSAFGDQKTSRERHDKRRDLADKTIADGELDEDIGRLRQRHAMARHADDDAAEDVDGDRDQAGDGLAAHELGGAVHGSEEGAFLLQLAPPLLRLLLVDQTRREVGIDGHLLAGDRVEREPGAHLGDTGRALRDHQEVDGDEDDEDHDADDEVTAHHELGEAADHMARGVDTLVPVGQDQAGRRNAQMPDATGLRSEGPSEMPKIRGASESKAPPSGSGRIWRPRMPAPCRSPEAGWGGREWQGCRPRRRQMPDPCRGPVS